MNKITTASLLILALGAAGCSSSGGGNGGGGNGGGGTFLGNQTKSPFTGRTAGRIEQSDVTVVGRAFRVDANGNPTSLTATSARGGETGVVAETRNGAELILDDGGVASAQFVSQQRNGALTGTEYETTRNAEDFTALAVIDAQSARLGIVATQNGDQGTAGYFYGAADDSIARPTSLTGKATYEGAAVALVADEANGVYTADGGLRLNADFAAGTVDGRISDIEGDGVGFLDEELLLENGTIRGADYQGDIVVVDQFTGNQVVDTSNGRADFQGGFYGPNGAETAGVIDLQGEHVDPRVGEIDIIGGYIGGRTK